MRLETTTEGFDFKYINRRQLQGLIDSFYENLRKLNSQTVESSTQTEHEHIQSGNLTGKILDEIFHCVKKIARHTKNNKVLLSGELINSRSGVEDSLIKLDLIQKVVNDFSKERVIEILELIASCLQFFGSKVTFCQNDSDDIRKILKYCEWILGEIRFTRPSDLTKAKHDKFMEWKLEIENNLTCTEPELKHIVGRPKASNTSKRMTKYEASYGAAKAKRKLVKSRPVETIGVKRKEKRSVKNRSKSMRKSIGKSIEKAQKECNCSNMMEEHILSCLGELKEVSTRNQIQNTFIKTENAIEILELWSDKLMKKADGFIERFQSFLIAFNNYSEARDCTESQAAKSQTDEKSCKMNSTVLPACELTENGFNNGEIIQNYSRNIQVRYIEEMTESDESRFQNMISKRKSFVKSLKKNVLYKNKHFDAPWKMLPTISENLLDEMITTFQKEMKI